MAKKGITNTKPSEPEKVAEYMRYLKHPMSDVVVELRKIILKTDPAIGEEIKWNAPTFFYTGGMKPSNPKEFKRYLVVFNLFRPDCVRLVFWKGSVVQDNSGFLEGDYADGRRLALFYGMDDVKSKKKSLENVLKQQLKNLAK